MTISSSASFDVADSSTLSASITEIIQAPAGVGTGGRGQLTHPTLGLLEYSSSPDEVVNFDGDVLTLSSWLHAQTLDAGVDTLWAGNLRDVVVTERWMQADVGSLLTHLRALYAFVANPPNPAAGDYVLWAPTHSSGSVWKVALVGLRAGGDQLITLPQRMKRLGYAPSPVELDIRIVALVGGDK